MPKPMYIASGLLQLRVVWAARHNLKPIAKNPKHVCALNIKKRKKDSITECLKELHWLPIKQRIHYKILTLTHKCVHRIGPKYMQDLIRMRPPTRRGLRSNGEVNLLVRPLTKCKTFADRSFSVGAPVLWNALPANMRSLDYLKFRKELKTRLFRQAFPP